MGKVCPDVIMEIGFDLFPIIFIVTDAFTPGADGQQELQPFDMIEGVGQVAGDASWFKQCPYLPRQRLQCLLLLRRQPAGLMVDGTQRSHGQPFRIDRWNSGINRR